MSRHCKGLFSQDQGGEETSRGVQPLVWAGSHLAKASQPKKDPCNLLLDMSRDGDSTTSPNGTTPRVGKCLLRSSLSFPRCNLRALLLVPTPMAAEKSPSLSSPSSPFSYYMSVIKSLLPFLFSGLSPSDSCSQWVQTSQGCMKMGDYAAIPDRDQPKQRCRMDLTKLPVSGEQGRGLWGGQISGCC